MGIEIITRSIGDIEDCASYKCIGCTKGGLANGLVRVKCRRGGALEYNMDNYGDAYYRKTICNAYDAYFELRFDCFGKLARSVNLTLNAPYINCFYRGEEKNSEVSDDCFDGKVYDPYDDIIAVRNFRFSYRGYLSSYGF